VRWWANKPFVERSLWDDVVGAVCVLFGVTVGWLVFGADDPGVLVASVVGLVIGVAGINVVRRARLRRRT
jgi:hypothetical protein